MSDTPDYSHLSELADIYGQLTGRDRMCDEGIRALDLLEDLIYNEVVEHHKARFPERYEEAATPTEPEQPTNEDE